MSSSIGSGSLSDVRSDLSSRDASQQNPSQQNRSTLGSTSGSSVAGHVEGNGSPPEPGSIAVSLEEDEALKQVHSVWDLEHVQKLGTTKADGGWKCLHCNQYFRYWNATKVLYHLAKIVGKDVRICKAGHDKKHRELYHSMLSAKDKNLTHFKAREAKFQAMVLEGQQSLAVMLEESRQRVSASSNAAMKTDSKPGGLFCEERTVESSTSSQLTMAIADFVHSCGLSFRVTESEYFKNILKYARGVPASYKPPSRNAIATSLLKINFDRRMKQ